MATVVRPAPPVRGAQKSPPPPPVRQGPPPPAAPPPVQAGPPAPVRRGPGRPSNAELAARASAAPPAVNGTPASPAVVAAAPPAPIAPDVAAKMAGLEKRISEQNETIAKLRSKGAPERTEDVLLSAGSTLRDGDWRAAYHGATIYIAPFLAGSAEAPARLDPQASGPLECLAHVPSDSDVPMKGGEQMGPRERAAGLLALSWGRKLDGSYVVTTYATQGEMSNFYLGGDYTGALDALANLQIGEAAPEQTPPPAPVAPTYTPGQAIRVVLEGKTWDGFTYVSAGANDGEARVNYQGKHYGDVPRDSISPA